MNTAEFHLNPRTWELWAKREEQRTLLFHIQSNYSTYVIELSLQRSLALFHSQERSKQTQKKKKKREWRRERQAEDGQQKTVCQLDADISNCSDRFSDEFLCRWIDPDQPSAQPDVLNLLFKACSKGCNHIRLTAYINDKRSKRHCFLQYLKRKQSWHSPRSHFSSTRRGERSEVGEKKKDKRSGGWGRSSVFFGPQCSAENKINNK